MPMEAPDVCISRPNQPQNAVQTNLTAWFPRLFLSVWVPQLLLWYPWFCVVNSATVVQLGFLHAPTVFMPRVYVHLAD